MASYYYSDTYIFAVDNFKETYRLAKEEYCSSCGVYFRNIHIGDKTYMVKDAVCDTLGEEHGTWLPHLTQEDFASYFRDEPTFNLLLALQEAHLKDTQIREFYRVSINSTGQAVSKIVVDRCSADGFFSEEVRPNGLSDPKNEGLKNFLETSFFC